MVANITSYVLSTKLSLKVLKPIAKDPNHAVHIDSELLRFRAVFVADDRDRFTGSDCGQSLGF